MRIENKPIEPTEKASVFKVLRPILNIIATILVVSAVFICLSQSQKGALVKRVAGLFQEIIAKKSFPSAYLGVSTMDASFVAVLEAFSGFPAEKAGIQRADIIFRIDNEYVEDGIRGLWRILYSKVPGEKVEVWVLRPFRPSIKEYEIKKFSVVLAERPREEMKR